MIRNRPLGTCLGGLFLFASCSDSNPLTGGDGTDNDTLRFERFDVPPGETRDFPAGTVILAGLGASIDGDIRIDAGKSGDFSIVCESGTLSMNGSITAIAGAASPAAGVYPGSISGRPSKAAAPPQGDLDRPRASEAVAAMYGPCSRDPPETAPMGILPAPEAWAPCPFGSRAVVSGVAQFRPSGKLLVIDVEHLGPARDGDAVFESAPKAVTRPVASPLLQDESAGVSAFFGTWPGVESDEELLGALEAIR